jgi:hypothetical protein
VRVDDLRQKKARQNHSQTSWSRHMPTRRDWGAFGLHIIGATSRSCCSHFGWLKTVNNNLTGSIPSKTQQRQLLERAPEDLNH